MAEVYYKNGTAWTKVTYADVGAAASVHNHAASDITSGTISVARGGTGASDAATARTNLGITLANLGAAASSHTHSYLPLTGGTLSGNLTISHGTTPTFTVKNSSSSDVAIVLDRTSNASWKMLNQSGNLYYQTDWVSGAKGAYHTVITIAYQTGNTTFAGTVTSTGGFSGSLSGNASTASTLQTARTINGTSFNGSANITTANWGTARTITIGSTGKSVNGSAAVTWTLAEIGAAASSHTHTYAGSSTAGGAATSAQVLNSNTRMNYGWNGINYFNISGTAGNAAKVNDTPTTAWWHILRFNHANASGYYTDLAVPFNANTIYYKRITNGNVQNSGWVAVLDKLNYTSYVTPSSIGAAATSHTHSYAATSHTHAATDITSGTLAVARGGTGVTANPSMLVNLAVTTAASVFAASPRPGVTGTLPVANGGTGVTTNAAIGLKAYPVGAVYISYVSTSPATLFGGTWTAITGRFPYFNAGTATGGSNTHWHYQTIGKGVGDFAFYVTDNVGPNGVTTNYPNHLRVLTGMSGAQITNAVGGAWFQSSNLNQTGTYNADNIPAYQTLYAWRRTA